MGWDQHHRMTFEFVSNGWMMGLGYRKVTGDRKKYPRKKNNMRKAREA